MNSHYHNYARMVRHAHAQHAVYMVYTLYAFPTPFLLVCTFFVLSLHWHYPFL